MSIYDGIEEPNPVSKWPRDVLDALLNNYPGDGREHRAMLEEFGATLCGQESETEGAHNNG